MTETLTPAQRALVDAELVRISISSQFKASKRSLRFLIHVVRTALNGESHNLKERTLGVELFGREPTFDTSGDATVRVAAGEVRRRLLQFYAENEPRGVRIHLPAGAYSPEFRWSGSDQEPVHPPLAAPLPAAPLSPVPRRRYRLLLALACLALVVCVAAWYWSRPQPTAVFLDYWQPILETSQPVLISIGVVESHHVNPSRTPAVARIGYPMVPLGDSIALSRITTLLNRNRKSFRLLGSAETGFPDLKDASAILIGASSNRWTGIAHSQLRFSIGVIPPDYRTGIVDSKDPNNRKWIASHFWPETVSGYDYAVVSRLLDPNTGAMVVTVAGLTPFGTQSAGEFVTDSNRLADVLRDLPAGWQSRNLQLVLRTRIVGANSGPASIVATDLR